MSTTTTFQHRLNLDLMTLWSETSTTVTFLVTESFDGRDGEFETLDRRVAALVLTRFEG